MDVQRAVDEAVIHGNIDTVGSVALAGIAALCGELARLGALDAAALKRIAGFMDATIEQSGGGKKLRQTLHSEVARHFTYTLHALDTAPPTTGSAQ